MSAALGATALPAQVIRPSQPAEVMQWVGATRINIAYHRPVARGRVLFGKLVPFDSVWSPSADTAATFTTSTRITVNGAPLAAGTYSIFAIPGQSDWTVYRGTVERTREWFDGGNRLGGRDPLQKLFSSRGYFGEECCLLRRARGRGLTT